MPAPEIGVRARILAAIAARPGIHVRELERTVGLSQSGVIHHLRILEREGAVRAVSEGHYHRYFSSDLVLPEAARQLNDGDRRLLAACRRPASLAILLHLAADRSLSHDEIGRRLRRSKGTVTYHLTRLVEEGLVRSAGSPPGKTYELADRERTLAILASFADTLRDHMESFAQLWLRFGERRKRPP